MKNRLALASACAIAVTGGAPAALAAPPFDHVVGGGQNNPPSPNPAAHFQINAKSNPDGTGATGTFTFHRTSDGPPVESFTADVTCLRIEGTVASIVGIVRKSKNDFPVGQAIRVRVEDNAQGNDGQDRIQNGRYAGDPQVCPPAIQPMREPFQFGNVNVFDR